MNGLDCPAGLVQWGVELRPATIQKHNQELPALLLGVGRSQGRAAHLPSDEKPPLKEGGYVTPKLFLISCTLGG